MVAAPVLAALVLVALFASAVGLEIVDKVVPVDIGIALVDMVAYPFAAVV